MNEHIGEVGNNKGIFEQTTVIHGENITKKVTIYTPYLQGYAVLEHNQRIPFLRNKKGFVDYINEYKVIDIVPHEAEGVDFFIGVILENDWEIPFIEGRFIDKIDSVNVVGFSYNKKEIVLSNGKTISYEDMLQNR